MEKQFMQSVIFLNMNSIPNNNNKMHFDPSSVTGQLLFEILNNH